jgi:hypothetical protein
VELDELLLLEDRDAGFPGHGVDQDLVLHAPALGPRGHDRRAAEAVASAELGVRSRDGSAADGRGGVRRAPRLPGWDAAGREPVWTPREVDHCGFRSRKRTFAARSRSAATLRASRAFPAARPTLESAPDHSPGPLPPLSGTLLGAGPLGGQGSDRKKPDAEHPRSGRGGQGDDPVTETWPRGAEDS